MAGAIGAAAGRRGRADCARLELLQRELELRDLRIELFGGATEAQALQAQQLDPQLLDQDIAREQLARIASLRAARLLLDARVLQRVDDLREVMQRAAPRAFY